MAWFLGLATCVFFELFSELRQNNTGVICRASPMTWPAVIFLVINSFKIHLNCLQHAILLLNETMYIIGLWRRSGDYDHALFDHKYHMYFHILHSNSLSLPLHCKQWLELSQCTLGCQTYLIFLVHHSRLAGWAPGNTSDVSSAKSCDIDIGVTAESRLLHLTRLWWGCRHVRGKGGTCS